MGFSSPLARAEVAGPRWRAEPYRILFPLGALLAWAGVLHWLFLATGAWNEYRPAFHAIAQIQGFLTCFAVGFLFTFVPRRTGAPPASAWQIAVAVLAPIGTVTLAWLELWVPSQGFWLLDVIVVLAFALGRLRRARGGGSMPPGFIWVPASLFGCLAAAVMAGVGGANGSDLMWLHEIGRSFIQQGLFTGLVLGVGSLLLPVLAYGKPPMPTRNRRALALHVAAICAFIASFVVEQLISTSAGFLIRAAVTAGVLFSAGLAHWPTASGLHRLLAWLAPWSLPFSALAVAVFPEYRKAGLHIAFIGCFALMVLSVSLHVVLTHAGRSARLEAQRWPVFGLGLLLASALVCRVLVDVDPYRFRLWLGAAASSFLAATVVWGYLVIPHLGAMPAQPGGGREAQTSPGAG